MDKMKYNIKKLYEDEEKDDDDFFVTSQVILNLIQWIKFGQIVQINLKS